MAQDNLADALAGRYRRTRLLGRGAMGEVWLADDLLLRRLVAVKSLAPRVSAPDEADLARLMREARVAAGLNHPNAVAVYDLCVVDGRPYVVMEYVAGETLAEAIARTGGLPAERVATIGAAVADALAEAHELGIVHRDLKPANIMLSARGVPKVADFGIARLTGDVHMTATGMFIGTPAYIAPEVARGGEADARSDVWSLGVTLYTALEGRTPFQRGADDGTFAVLARVLDGEVQPLRLTGAVPDVVAEILGLDPARRPTAATIATLLRDASASGLGTRPVFRPTAAPATVIGETAGPAHGYAPYGGGSAPPPGPPAPLSLPPARGTGAGRYVWVGAAALVLVAAVIIAVVLVGNRGGGRAGAAGSSPGSTTSTGSSTVASDTAGNSASDVSSAPPSAFGGSPAPSAGPATPYDAPAGGLVVDGPAGWVEKAVPGSTNVVDYVHPGDTEDTGPYFRIGIGSTNPASSPQSEMRLDVRFLRRTLPTFGYTDIMIRTHRYVAGYQGTTAIDIDSTATNPDGYARRNEQRLWISNGVEYEIELNAPAGEWSADQPIFTQLVSSAFVN